MYVCFSTYITATCEFLNYGNIGFAIIAALKHASLSICRDVGRWLSTSNYYGIGDQLSSSIVTHLNVSYV